MLLPQCESANRCIAQPLTVVQGGAYFATFGPFQPGEYIKALRLLYATDGDGHNTAFMDVLVYANNRKPATTAEAQAGRCLMTQGTPRVPFALTFGVVATPLYSFYLDHELDIAHVITEHELYLSVVLNISASNINDAVGSVWLIPGHSDIFDPAE